MCECVLCFICVFQDLKTFVSELCPCYTSKCDTLPLQPLAQSHVVIQQRSHSNVWTLLPLPSPERQMKLSARTKPQKCVSQLVCTGSGSLSCHQCLYILQSVWAFAALWIVNVQQLIMVHVQVKDPWLGLGWMHRDIEELKTQTIRGPSKSDVM